MTSSSVSRAADDEDLKRKEHIDATFSVILQKKELMVSTTGSIKLLAVYDFNPKVMNLREEKELIIIFKRCTMTEQEEHVLKNADNLNASLSTQDKQIIPEDKVGVYNSIDKTLDFQDKMVKIEEPKTVMQQVEILTLDGKSHWESSWESVGEFSGKSEVELKREIVNVCNRKNETSNSEVEYEDGAVQMEELHDMDSAQYMYTRGISGLSLSDKQIIREDGLKTLKVKVYSRQEEISDLQDEDLQGTVKMQEPITSEEDYHWQPDWESEPELEGESEEESVQELVSNHSDESDFSKMEDELYAVSLVLAFGSGDKMETFSSENIGDTDGWWIARHLDNGKIGFIPRNRVIMENDHESSGTTLNELPFELLDLVLESSFLHWILNSSDRRRDHHVIKTLASVEYCWFKRTTRRSFKKRIWQRFKDFYSNRPTQKRSTIIRSNQNYLLENIQPTVQLMVLMSSSNCITERQSHLLQRRRSKRYKNAELLNFLKSFDETKFSNVIKCLRQTNQKKVARIMEDGGGVVKVEVHNRDPKKLHKEIEDLQNRKKSLSHEADKISNKLKDEGIEILNSQLDRQIVIVWICCYSKTALRSMQELCKSNQLADIIFGFANIRPPTSGITRSTVINVDQNHFQKTIVKYSIYTEFSKEVYVGKGEEIFGMTKLRNKIYVLCDSSSQNVIRIFEDQHEFHLQKKLKFQGFDGLLFIESSEQDNCLYSVGKIGANYFIWKVTIGPDEQHKLIKWLDIDEYENEPCVLSVSCNGQVFVTCIYSASLRIYGSDAKLLRSIQLPRNMGDPARVVETSIGHFIVLYQSENKKKNEGERSDKEEEKEENNSTVIEVSNDGEKVIRRFNPSDKIQKLDYPEHLVIDSGDRVFVAVRGNHRVILLDPDLKWNNILCSTEKTETNKKLDIDNMPGAFWYDEENKQLIVRGMLHLGEGINVYNVCRK